MRFRSSSWTEFALELAVSKLHFQAIEILQRGSLEPVHPEAAMTPMTPFNIVGLSHVLALGVLALIVSLL
jgi:hypothetical protein